MHPNLQPFIRSFIITTSAVLSACANVAIFSPTDKPGQQTGQVTGLKDIVGNDSSPLTLVFVHGVNDTCRGYAIGDEAIQETTNDSWLNDSVSKALGLTYMPKSQNNFEVTSTEIGIGGNGKPGVNVTLIRQRNYTWKVPGSAKTLEVHAFEVTWSPMTRWIKNYLVGYDAAPTSIFSGEGGPSIPTCKYDTADTLGNQTPPTPDPWFSPTSRVVANGSLKWYLMDRALADAVIYAGTYGEAMQRGLAAALCRIAGGAETNAQPCVWPKGGDLTQGHFVFVTHSLGSRLLYDTLLNLSVTNGPTNKYPNGFSANYIAQATPVVNAMIAQTAGFYMMANQLTMLGTANVPVNAPFNQQHPYIVHGSPQPQDTAAGDSSLDQADSFVRLLKIRDLSPRIQSASPTLAIVSFDDTNDLLTWHVPAWYVTALGEHAYGIQVADAFVKNATHILWSFEWPPSAHGGYFTDRDVWEVMVCGADRGTANKCLH